MLWAIDVGNTQTVVGIHDGDSWVAHWRLTTDRERTEDELAAHFHALCAMEEIEFSASGVVVASVVPPVDQTYSWFADRVFGVEAKFLRTGADVGVRVDYDPSHAVGADRIANALGALARFQPPIIVVDFGTATTLDCIDRDGVYVGGAILPGVTVSLDSLVGRTAKLPMVGLSAPKRAIGKSTVESLQAGVVLGYVGAIDTLVMRASAELGGDVKVVTTGGLGSVFGPLCRSTHGHYDLLTLEGLKIGYERMVLAGAG